MESSTASSGPLLSIATAYDITNTQIAGDSLAFWINHPNIIPDPTVNVNWDVYLFSYGTSVHWCLLFRSVNTGNSFFVDLVLADCRRRVDFRMKAINAAVNNLPHLGQIHTSMMEILIRAHIVLRDFGQYIGLVNNCQHYVANLAANLAADFGPLNLQEVIPSIVPPVIAVIIIGVVLCVYLQIYI